MKTCLMARIRSVAYDQIRSMSLIIILQVSEVTLFDRERLLVLSSTAVDSVVVTKVGDLSGVEVREQWSCYDDAFSAMHGS